MIFSKVWETYSSFIFGESKKVEVYAGVFSACRNFLCILISLVKNIGRALKKYNSHGSIVIFNIDALPKHKNGFGDHFLRSCAIVFNSGLKLVT